MSPIYLSAKLEVTALQQHLQVLANDQYVLFHAVDYLEMAMKRMQVQKINQSPVTPFYVCEECNKSFPTEPTWRNHLRRIHKF